MIKEKFNILKQLCNENKYKEAIDYASQLLVCPMSNHVKCHIYMFLSALYLEIDNYRLFIYYRNKVLNLIPKDNWIDRLKVLGEIAIISHYIPELSDDELAQRHLVAQEIVKDVSWIWNENKIKEYVKERYNDSTDKKIRVGYISADIYSHINLCFTIQLLVGYNRNKFDIHVYMMNKEHDITTEFIMQHVSQCYDVSSKKTKEIAQQIADDKIDILVDTSIYSGDQKTPPVIAYKPAPVIIAGIGYMSSSGMNAVDYFLTDGYCDPIGQGDGMFSEKLVRLPRTHFCYTPMEHVQKFSVNTEIHSPIRFGSLNTYTKINETVLKSWKCIMNRVPDSRLVLQSNSSEISAKEMRYRLCKAGFDMERIEMRPASINYFATYNDIDIALDSYPYVGGGTTCDALYMGVPVVSRYGSRHGTRFSYSLLQNVGLGELTASTWQEYEDIAVNLANNTDKLKYLHENIRSMMQRSPIMDFKGYVADVEDAYIRVWHNFIGENYRKIWYNENSSIREENNMSKLKKKNSKKVGVVKSANKFDDAKMQKLLQLKEKMTQQVTDEDYVEAMDTMAEIAKEKILDIDTMCMGARCYVMTGDNERAIKWINNLLSCDKDNVQARILLGRICFMEDRIDEGIAIFEVVASSMMQRVTDIEKEEMEDLLDFYRYSDPDMLMEKAPHVAALLGLGIENDKDEESEVAPAPSEPICVDEAIESVEKESEVVVSKDEEAAQRAREAVARLRALLSKHKQESQEGVESVLAQESVQESVAQPTPVEENGEVMSEGIPEDVQESSDVVVGFDVNGVTMQIMEKPVSLREKVKLFNTFAAGCYVNGDYQSAFDLLSAALQLDGEDVTVIKNLAYVCAAAGEVDQAMDFVSKLSMIDFAILKNIR